MRVIRAGGMRVDYTVQRRRRKKAAPKNIFGATSQTSSKAKTGSISKPKLPKPRSPRAAPPSAPGSRPKPVPKPEPSTISKIKQDKQTDPVEAEGQSDVAQILEPEETILESQMLGVKNGGETSQDKKSTISEKKPAETISKVKPNTEDSGTSLKARQIIEDSILRASLAAEKEKTSNVSKKRPPETRVEPKKPQKKFRNKTSSYQPANRARRLDRSRHMEYKYEMRRLLVEIGVSEEFRSNLLATIWARGERQTTKEAKDFLQEKLDEGIINDDQMESLEGVVDAYTIRR
tara:strand:+ start:69 stop:941 length:873 start_codon:yes stop_codon:yes gene_type:complete